MQGERGLGDELQRDGLHREGCSLPVATFWYKIKAPMEIAEIIVKEALALLEKAAPSRHTY